MGNKLTLTANLSPLQTEIYFGLDLLASLCHKISKQGAIFADAQILASHGQGIQKLLGYELICVPTGEKAKTREVKKELEDELLKRKLGRDSVIVAVGGGVISDLVGFIASTYMRGVPLILVPTTLLSMVDAAIGGKTGVDTAFGKNTIGTFYLPQAVFIHFPFLETLPEEELKNGLSEILKYGLIHDSTIWEKRTDWKKDLPFLIRASIHCKVQIVQNDFEEKTGLRRILNFGHTVGHALELLSNFQMAHGKAVALGCMAESHLSHLLGYLPEDTLHSILQFYDTLGYEFPEFNPQAFIQALCMDKKAKEGNPRFVLIDRIGHCLPLGGQYCRSLETGQLDLWIERMQYAICKN